MSSHALSGRSRNFYAYVIPSIGSMLVTSLYVVVDGIFVGQGIGVDALAAINIAGPYIMAIIAVSMMITVGGATMVGISLGQKKVDQANRFFMTSMKLIIGLSLFVTVLSFAFPTQIARLFGASDLLVADTATYLKYFVLFGVFFCSAMALAAFVRNDGDPKLAFWGMISGGIANIFLDWLFIFPLHLGIVGPAIASGLGQTLSCLVLLTHFWRKKGVLHAGKQEFSGADVQEIVKRGTPEFMNQLFQPITVLCYNLLALHFYGEIGVAAFSVVYYVLTITVSVFIGLSQGVQPLMSRSFGEENREDERYYFLKGLGLNFLLALVVYVAMFIFGKPVITLFNSDADLVRIGYDCIRIYGLSFMLTAINIVAITYFTSTKRTAKAFTISALRCLVFIPASVFALPALWGEGAVWTGIILAEALSLVIVGGMLLHQKKKQD